MFTPQFFARRYILLDRIATGGMAEVFKAKSRGVEGFEKLVVIKRILPHLSRNPRFVSMFINEAKIAVSLTHGNIAQVFNLGKYGEDYYIAMEYVHGRDLMQVLKVCRQRSLRLPLPLLLYVIGEIAKGLDYAHRKQNVEGKSLQIIHRDISPHNIVVSFEGDVKIVDFGIARIVSEVMEEEPKTRLGGKFAYMSPEQARGAGLDPRSDLFSLGLVMYELITGQKAYQARNLSEKLEEVRNARFVPPRKLAHDLPVEVERILLKLLALEPEQRYAAASDLYEDLTEYMFSTCGVMTSQSLANFLRELFLNEIAREQQHVSLNAVVGSLGGEEHGELELSNADELSQPAPASDVRDEQTGEVEVTGEDVGGRALPLVHARGNLKRQLVVLMAEPIGLVDLAAQFTDDRYVELLSELLTLFRDTLQSFGGYLDSFVYDRLCVLWGLQRAQEDDAERAVLCALALRNAVEKLRQQRRVYLTLSCALHVGTGLVGLHDGQVRHTALGDVFKLPLRLLGEADPGEIWLSDALRHRVEVAFKLAPGRPLRTFWGKREVQVFQVLALHTPHERARLQAARLALRDRWLSRGDEQERLAAALSEVSQRRGVILGITGEAGIGKSRYVLEIGRRVHRSAAWVVGLCNHKERQTPLAVFRDMLAAGCRLQPNDPPERIREKLDSLLELGLQPKDVRAFASLFVAGDHELPAGGEGVDMLDAINLAARRLVRGMSADRPVIFVFENVQWMDEATWKLVQSIVELSTDLPVMLLLTYRQSFVPSLATHPTFREIRLASLSLERTAELLQSLLSLECLPIQMVEEFHRRSDGNPLYLEQLVKFLLENRQLLVENGAARLLSPQAASLVPPTLAGLIESRVDSISMTGRELLHTLVVAGRQIRVETLRHIFALPIPMEPVLQELVSRDLVTLADGVISFRNNLTWEVAYNSLPHRDRRTLHLKVGEALEGLYQHELQRHAEELYHHFEEGGVASKAARYAGLAGDRYAAEDFLSNAIGFYLKAIEILRASSEDGIDEERVLFEMALLYLRAGRLQAVTGDRSAAETTLEHGLAIAGELEDDVLEVRFLLELGPLRAEKGDLVVARNYLEHAAELVEELSNVELHCAVLDALGTFYLDVNERTAALKTFQRGLRLAEDSGKPLAIARLLRGRGTWRLHHGEEQDALDDLSRALELVEQAGDKLLVGRIMTNIGNMYNLMGQAEEAMTYYRRSGEIYQTLGFIRGVIINAHNVGDLYFRTGRLARAHASFQESRNMARDYRWSRGEAFNLVYMGFIEAEMGDAESGMKNLQEGIQLAQKVGAREFVCVGTWLEGRYFLKREPERARLCLERALELARVMGEVKLEDEVRQTLASLSGVSQA